MGISSILCTRPMNWLNQNPSLWTPYAPKLEMLLIWISRFQHCPKIWRSTIYDYQFPWFGNHAPDQTRNNLHPLSDRLVAFLGVMRISLNPSIWCCCDGPSGFKGFPQLGTHACWVVLGDWSALFFNLPTVSNNSDTAALIWQYRSACSQCLYRSASIPLPKKQVPVSNNWRNNWQSTIVSKCLSCHFEFFHCNCNAECRE